MSESLWFDVILPHLIGLVVAVAMVLVLAAVGWFDGKTTIYGVATGFFAGLIGLCAGHWVSSCLEDTADD